MPLDKELLEANIWKIDRFAIHDGPGIRTNMSYASAFYHRIARRRGNGRAAVATGHHLSRCIYHVLKEGKPYQNPGADYFDRRNSEMLRKQLLRRLEGLGYRVELSLQTATV